MAVTRQREPIGTPGTNLSTATRRDIVWTNETAKAGMQTVRPAPFSQVAARAIKPTRGTDTMDTLLHAYKAGFVCPMNPIPQQIHIEDIARGLAHKCRWNGQTRQFYSVAEHSIHVMEKCNPEFALWGLLHDAGEAPLFDCPAPYKDQVWFHVPGPTGVIRKIPYIDVEIQIRNMVLRKAGCVMVNTPDVVHEADMIIRRWEERELVSPDTRETSTFVPMAPHEAMAVWLMHYDRLVAQAEIDAMDCAGVA